jgi:hypothetical protein
VCELWNAIESENNYTSHIVGRVGDPNRFKEPNPHNLQTLAWLYQEQGFSFNLNVNDIFEVGIAEVSKMLHYDQLLYKINPHDPAALPHLMVCKSCVNTQRAIKNFSMKKSRNKTKDISENADPKFKDFADIVRYLVMWHKNNPFNQSRVDEKKISDVQKLKMSRIPKQYREQPKFGFNSKGRRVLTTGVI